MSKIRFLITYHRIEDFIHSQNLLNIEKQSDRKVIRTNHHNETLSSTKVLGNPIIKSIFHSHLEIQSS